MIVVPADSLLTPEALAAPTLNVLIGDASNYSVLLLQPQGQINATHTGVQSRNRQLAAAQFGTFLDEAVATQPDLVITPEYAMPWGVLRDAITAGHTPARGKLWALGCESIKYSELQTLKMELAGVATVVFETLQPDDTKFVDPLAYVFRTTPISNNTESRLVVLVQFKTHPMADKHEFEKNLLQLGTRVYQFGTYGAGISLVSLICSDVFAFTGSVAEQVRDRALVLHLQMNPDPRHDKFLDCRRQLLGFEGDQTEILSLNWASDVEIWIDGAPHSWTNIAGSAWYVKIRDIDSADATLAQNHRRGLYYTWLETHRSHALFFNFSPAVFYLTASKVARLNVPGAVGVRRGPQLDFAKTWDVIAAAWKLAPPDDGFSEILRHCGEASAQVEAMFTVCPLACERLVALCAGNADHASDWFSPRKLDSFVIKATELISRVTFCQDTSTEATEFRVRRLKRCATLWSILQTPTQLPPALKDLAGGYSLEWRPEAQHQNLKSLAGERATVMYLGEDSDEATVTRAYKSARERVRRSVDEEAAERATQRVAVWYRGVDGTLHCQYDIPKINRRRGESEHYIGRQS